MRYLEMLKSAEFRDDLDVVSTIHTPKGRCAVCLELSESAVRLCWFNLLRFDLNVCQFHADAILARLSSIELHK